MGQGESWSSELELESGGEILLEFRVRGCPQNSTPIVGKRGSATASPLLRAFQLINM